MKTYVLHFLGSMYPSRPGLTGILLIDAWQERHCTVNVRAFAFTPEAATTKPTTLTSLLTSEDCKKQNTVNTVHKLQFKLTIRNIEHLHFY